MASRTPFKLNPSYLSAIIVASVAFVCRIPSWYRPFEMDEGLYAYAGWRILKGLVMYKDLFDHKPPGIYYLNALIFYLTSPDAINMYVAASICVAFTAVGIYLIAKRIWNQNVGLLAGILFGILASSPYVQGNGVNTEVFMNVPLVWSFYLLIGVMDRPTSKPVSYNRLSAIFFVAGLLVGTATVFKQVAFAFVPVALLALFYSYRMSRLGFRYAGKPVLLLLAGIALPWVAAFLYFLAKDAVSDFVFWQFKYPLYYLRYNQARGTTQAIVQRIFRVLLGTLFFWAWSCIGVVAAVISRDRRQWLLWGYLLVSIIGVCAGSLFFMHYFLQAVPPLAILSAGGLFFVWSKVRSLKSRVVALVAACFLVFTSVFFVVSHYKFYFVYSGDDISYHEYKKDFGDVHLFATARKIGYALKSSTDPTDRIYVFAVHPEINFYALRTTPTRLPLAAVMNMFMNNSKQVLIYDLTENKPEYVLIFDRFGKSFPELSHLLDNHYVKVCGVPGLPYPEQGVYRRRD